MWRSAIKSVAVDLNNAEQGIFTLINTEPDNWGFEFDFDLLLETAINWYTSKSALPATKEEMIERDPLWDSNVRRMRRLIQYQIDGLPKPKTETSKNGR